VFELLRESAKTMHLLDQDDENPAKLVSETMNKKITPTNFNVAYSSIEQVAFKDVVDLFDANRKRSALERWFTPPEVKKYLFRDKEVYERQKSLSGLGSNSQDVPDSLDARKRMIYENSLRTKELLETAQRVDSILDKHSQSLEILHEKLQHSDAEFKSTEASDANSQQKHQDYTQYL